MAGDPGSVTPVRLAGRARLLLAAPFVMFFDRFSIAPLLVPIAHDLHVPLSQVAVAATVYYVLYGAMQLVYGVISDRVGRVRLMRMTCLGVAITAAISASAPNLAMLLVGRALTAAVISSLFPASLTYIADTFPFQVRQRAVADLLTAVALGTAAATFGAGLLATYATWRLAFLLPGLAGVALSVTLRWLPESLPAPARGSTVDQLRRAALRPWMIFLCLVGIPEGASILGFLTFLAPALEAAGATPAVAGSVVGVYGVAVLAGTHIVRRLAVGVRPWVLIASGGGCLVLCFGLAAIRQSESVVLVASILAGLAYATMHSTFQTWATEAAPELRGTGTALFATAAFLGAGLATAGLAGLAGGHRYSELFWIAAAVTAPTMAIGAVGRRWFPDQGAGAPEARPAA